MNIEIKFTSFYRNPFNKEHHAIRKATKPHARALAGAELRPTRKPLKHPLSFSSPHIPSVTAKADPLLAVVKFYPCKTSSKAQYISNRISDKRISQKQLNRV